jgi:Glycosyl transferase family 2
MRTVDARTDGRAEAPSLSVVVASVNGWPVLAPTLRALDAQPERGRMEVIVVDTVGGATREQLRAHRPAVELVEVSERLAIPHMRFLGVERARAQIVAIVEDHGEVSRGWASAVLRAHQGRWGAVGGPVENGREGLVNWAVFFCEYSAYMGPLPEGESTDLPGNNIAYKRPHLMRHAKVLAEGKWESWINDRLRADGVPLAVANDMVVRHIKPFRLGQFLIQRFHFSRSYAGMRRSEQSVARRLFFGFGSLALPALLLMRIARQIVRKRRYRGKFAASVPLLLLFLSVGALGEMTGYFLGPGASLECVE